MLAYIKALGKFSSLHSLDQLRELESSHQVSRSSTDIMSIVKHEICHVLLVILMLCMVHTQPRHTYTCEEKNICITNGTHRDSCRSHNTTNNISILNTLLQCKNVSIQFTGGTYDLTNNVDFMKATSITIFALAGEQSTIVCNNSGISFGENNSVFIENIIFHSCSRNQTVTKKTQISAALLFKTANYTLTNVIVTHVQGFSLYSYRCQEQVITDCKFAHNSGPARINFRYGGVTQGIINIIRTCFTNGTGSEDNSGGLQVDTTDGGADSIKIIIADCKFDSNSGQYGSHLFIESNSNNNMSIKIMNSTFSAAKGDNSYGVIIIAKQGKNNIETYITNCTFAGNENGALHISEVCNASIHNCSVLNNNGTGIVIISKQSFRTKTGTATNISNSTFKNNARALLLNLTLSKHTNTQETNIEHCIFTDHNVSSMTKPSEVVLIQGGSDNNNTAYIESCTFQSNHGTHGNCSALNIESMNNVSLNNVTVTDNNCTGIMLTASDIYIKNQLNVMRNSGVLGGGIQMKKSRQDSYSNCLVTPSNITMMPQSILNITSNTALFYGGGIFTDTHCNNGTECFLKFEDTSSPVIHLEGNTAKLGGDAIYGTCLSNQSSNNVFFLQDNNSESVVADQAKRVIFCSQGEIPSCENSQRNFTAFRGEVLKIPLLAVDDCCTPSGGTTMAITRQKYEAKGESQPSQLHSSCRKCENYDYLVTAGANESIITITIELLQEVRSQVTISSNQAVMTVQLANCTIGFIISEDKCTCNTKKLEPYKITCSETDYSLLVPPSTWIGYLENRSRVGITTRCEHCSKGAYKMTSKSQDLHCNGNRKGILCGSCINGYSLQLGDNLCSDCSKSAYKGVLLLITFAVMGIILVVVLLSLNLTVSTGLINAMIFYCNIVHTNREIFLPVDADHAQPHLQNMVRFFRIFQAWMNLDFGINTCFFPDFNTYISTWMQFLFPVFIWLLILALVVVSKYSSKVSRLTGSKTVPALATLLLLSYTKLLIAIISAGSYTTLSFLEHNETHKVWILDGNVAYLKGKHIPLFLMSLLMGILYTIPFTLIVVLGPLLQTKSDHMLLSWINRVKPLLDAFYGPYDGRYRYWPGLLLLARLILICIFAYYSEGDIPYKLAVIIVVVVMVYTVWNLLGHGNMHGKKHLNYLEVFFDVNLITFSSFSMYLNFTKTTVKNQQILAVVMVGSVFLVFFGIIVYQVIQRLKVARELLAVVAATRVWSKIKGRAESVEEVQERQSSAEGSNTQATHSVLKMTPLQLPCELREPLLCD